MMTTAALPSPSLSSTAALNSSQTLSTAIRRLASIDPEQPTRFEDLVALNEARKCLNELFRAYSDELRTDPETTELWDAISAATRLASKQGSPKQKNVINESDEQVLMFWETFAGRFTWDFLPVDFLHALYEHWMTEQFPNDVAFSKFALTRRLKSTAAKSGDWFHTRARPGTLMKAAEPLAARVPGWTHDGSDAAIYGLRRSGV